MAVILPTNPGPLSARGFPIDFGGVQKPFLGGPEQRQNRLGMRMGLRVTMGVLRGVVARQFTSRLMRGLTQGVLYDWPLLDLDPGSPPAPAIAATSTGTAIQVKGLGAGYLFVEGQPLSVIHDGRRYMHLTTGVIAANSSGVAVVGINPPTRVSYSENDTVEIVQPKIQGFIATGDEAGWDMAIEHTMGFGFTITESR